MGLLRDIGAYLKLMRRVFTRPEKSSVFRYQFVIEGHSLGIDSLGIVAIISVFMGAVVAIQTAFNIDSPLIPDWTVGFTTRQSVILEFSPTIISLFLAGKVGSRVASEIGTMRVTEQIDALEIMGINSAAYLIFPKIIAAVVLNPILIIISMFLSIFGGWAATVMTGLGSSVNFIEGLQFEFSLYDVFYALTKTVVFAFLITSVSGYHGYTTKGGALEVGRASTRAVVFSSIAIIVANLVLTQLLLS
ncbi:MAG: ABC transporter permease [Bacteroidales bacterium]|nr:ABC transporter permease [Bacteroidales bacterium]